MDTTKMGGEMRFDWGGVVPGPPPPDPQFSTAKGRKVGTNWKETLPPGSLTDAL